MPPRFTGCDWLLRQIGREAYPLVQGMLTALCVLGAALREDLRLPFSFVAILLVPSQVCLIALWGTLSTDHVAARVGRALRWTGGLFFCIIGPASLNPEGLLPTWPFWVALAILGLIASTALAAMVVRRYGWRLVIASTVRETAASERKPLQFHLSDAFRWITTACVFLALSAATIPRFSSGEAALPTSITELLGMLPFGSLCIILVMGCMATLVVWLVLVDSGSSGLFLRQYWQLFLVLLIAALWLDQGGPSFGMGPPPFQIVFGVTFGFGLPLAVNTLVLREYGWRLVRTGVPVDSTRPT